MKELSKYQVKCKIIKGDNVMIMVGRSKGTTGKVERVDRKNDCVYVSGANIYKRHQRPDTKHPDGGIVEKIMPVHISNVMLVDPKTNKPTRIGFKQDTEGKKIRFAKVSGTTL